MAPPPPAPDPEPVPDVDPGLDLDQDPDAAFAPWDGRRVPVTLVGGYLGAGKTTALNHLLARTDRPIAVLVNDVGAVNIDRSLIARHHGDTIELTDGCVCCSLGQGLAAAFDQLRARPAPPDHVVIELSGVADPSRVVPWADSIGFRLDAIVVLADADQLGERLADDRVGPIVGRQLDTADLVLVTKADLAGAERTAAVTGTIRRRIGDRPILPADADTVAGLLDLGTRRPGGATATPTPTLFDVHRTETIGLPDPATTTELDEVLDRLGPDVVRAKGVARDHDGGLLLIQQVGRRRSITPLPEAEGEPPTDLVAISVVR